MKNNTKIISDDKHSHGGYPPKEIFMDMSHKPKTSRIRLENHTQSYEYQQSFDGKNEVDKI